MKGRVKERACGEGRWMGFGREEGPLPPGWARTQEVGRSRELTLADINNFDNDDSDQLLSPHHVPNTFHR